MADAPGSGLDRTTARQAASNLLATLPRKYKNRLRARWKRAKKKWVQTFRSYGPPELVEALRALGIHDGKTVMLHSAFKDASGFLGSPADVAETFLEAVGEGGNLVMVSLPTTGASYDYLSRVKVFDLNKTPSRMGLVSEFFRRRKGVLRSRHPSHPVLAYGPKAGWIVEAHDRCLYPCGPDSPFDRVLALGGTAVFFDTGLDKMTFFHWLEHHVQDEIDVPLYQPEPFDVPVIGADGNEGRVRTFAYSQEIIDRRRDFILHREMWRRGIVRKGRVGNTTLLAVRLKDVVRCVDEMKSRGVFFYDLD